MIHMKAHGPEDGHAHARIGQRHHFPVVATVLGSALRASRVISSRVIDIACRHDRIPTMPFKRSPSFVRHRPPCHRLAFSSYVIASPGHRPISYQLLLMNTFYRIA